MTRAAQVRMSNGSPDDERRGIDTRMIYSTVVTGGVHAAVPPGEMPSITSHLHSLDFCADDDSHR